MLISIQLRKKIFFFKTGNLYYLDENKEKKERLYVHLQKRKLSNYVSNLTNFIILPDMMIDYSLNFNIDEEFEREDYIDRLLQINNTEYHSLFMDNTNKKLYFQPKQEELKMLKEENSS